MKTPRFLLRGFRRPREVASLALGRLEREVLEEIWRQGESGAQQVDVQRDLIMQEEINGQGGLGGQDQRGRQGRLNVQREISVRDIFVSFEERVAYTTLMTTLDRLYKKGLLARRKSGRAFLYSPLIARQDFEQGIAEDVIEGLLGSGAHGVEPVLACIVDTVSQNDRELLDELDRLIREKRRELEEER